MLLLISSCEDLEQFPPNLAEAGSLTEFTSVLNAAYYYQHASATPMAIMGDFRADNALMEEEPFPSFDRFDSDLTVMEDQFFGPFYTALYKSILSANSVIDNSQDNVEVAEAKFLRALSYFKLVRVFGDVPVNLSGAPSTSDPSIFIRQTVSTIYNTVIIPDLEEAIDVLDTEIVDGRASKYAAAGILGKVFIQMGDFVSAEPYLSTVINGAEAAGISLQSNFSDIFGEENDLNSEIIFSTQFSSSVSDEYGFTEFASWFSGGDSKSFTPLDSDLAAAFDAVSSDIADPEVGDLRRASTINETNTVGVKWGDQADQDWIELRLAEVILLYAEVLNENGSATEEAILNLLDPIRTRAGLNVLDHTVVNSQSLIRQAIYDERRLELAFEGQRWFDLVRTGTVDAEMGESETINSNYYLFPIPVSEILATNGVITQNPGY